MCFFFMLFFSIVIAITYADPENFVRGGPTLTTFFFVVVVVVVFFS